MNILPFEHRTFDLEEACSIVGCSRHQLPKWRSKLSLPVRRNKYPLSDLVGYSVINRIAWRRISLREMAMADWTKLFEFLEYSSYSKIEKAVFRFHYEPPTCCLDQKRLTDEEYELFANPPDFNTALWSIHELKRRLDEVLSNAASLDKDSSGFTNPRPV